MDRKSIDALKGIGILGIVLVHYGLETSIDLISGVVFQGARGVQLMFIINAFLIFNSLSKIELSRENIIKWWKQKFLRLIPLYYFFTLLYVCVFGREASYYLGTFSKISWVNVLANLLFLHGFYPYFINSINVNWFMADLAVFYIVAPFLYRKINSLEKACITLLTVVSAGYLLGRFAVTLEVIQIQGIWEDYVNIMSFFSELPIMLLGVVAYFIYVNVIQVGKIKSPKLFSFASLIIAGILSYSLVLNEGYFVIFNTVFSFGVIFFTVFIGQMIHPWKIIRNDIFSAFGKHSYGIYLSHIFIVRLLKRLGISGDHSSILVRVIGFCIVALLALFVSIVVEEIIEKRMVNLVENCYRKKKIGTRD